MGITDLLRRKSMNKMLRFIFLTALGLGLLYGAERVVVCEHITEEN